MRVISSGGLYLRFRQWSEHGLVTAYYRDIIRPRILHTAPITGTTDRACELHVMTCQTDWLNLIWSLKTFYHYSKRNYALCIHEDGTAPPQAIEQLRYHFPDARLISRVEADARSEIELQDYPRSLKFRRTNVLAPKVFDFSAFLQSDRMLLFDSDLLFFKEPTALLRRIEDPTYRCNAFNADCGHGYTVQPSEVRQRTGYELLPRINSGLGLIHKDSIRPDWCEECLGLPGILDGHFWRIEQTLIALCSSRFAAELLPDEYTLHLGRGIGARPFRHYVGVIRHLMYREGIATLSRAGFLRPTL